MARRDISLLDMAAVQWADLLGRPPRGVQYYLSGERDAPLSEVARMAVENMIYAGETAPNIGRVAAGLVVRAAANGRATGFLDRLREHAVERGWSEIVSLCDQAMRDDEVGAAAQDKLAAFLAMKSSPRAYRGCLVNAPAGG